jgi:hypothetical protein
MFPGQIEKKLPAWLRDVYANFPLQGLELGIPNDFGWEKFKGRHFTELPLMRVSLLPIEQLVEQSLRYFPACELIRFGYLCIAQDIESTGEYIFIRLKDPDPAPCLVFHDGGENHAELIRGAEILAPSLSDFFLRAKIHNDHVQVPAERLEDLKRKLLVFFELVDAELANQMANGRKFALSESKIEEILVQRSSLVAEKEYLKSLFRCQWLFEEGNMNLPKEGREMLLEIYKFANLHLPDLDCLWKD